MNREVRVLAFCAAVACGVLNGHGSRADNVTVYRETCGWEAFENWNLVCNINKNTFITNEPSVSFSNAFKGLRSVTVCVSFSNRGGLNVPAIIVHNHNDGSRSKPTELFDTVKFRGNVAPSKMSWIGTSPRGAPTSAANWSLRADLFRTGDQGPFVYSEALSNGQGIIREIRATCSFIEDSDGSTK
jgi:hypothetical protein